MRQGCFLAIGVLGLGFLLSSCGGGTGGGGGSPSGDNSNPSNYSSIHYANGKGVLKSQWLSMYDDHKLNKKDIKKLAKSYEERVSQILSGTVPWSSTYFQLGSLFSMPSSRTLYDAYGKNYIKPSDAEIENILEKLDEENPDWDNLNPELFYSDLKTISST